MKPTNISLLPSLHNVYVMLKKKFLSREGWKNLEVYLAKNDWLWTMEKKIKSVRSTYLINMNNIFTTILKKITNNLFNFMNNIFIIILNFVLHINFFWHVLNYNLVNFLISLNLLVYINFSHN